MSCWVVRAEEKNIIQSLLRIKWNTDFLGKWSLAESKPGRDNPVNQADGLLNFIFESKQNKTAIKDPFYKYNHVEKTNFFSMVLGVFFPCYLFCAFVCCLLLAMLHVCIYREKHSCYGVFICSCTFSSRTGEVTFYNFTQFYASSCLKIGKKAKQIKTFLLCHRK